MSVNFTHCLHIHRNSDLKYLAGAVFVLFLYMFPYFSSNPLVLIHDNLDANYVWAKVLAENGQIFDSIHSSVPNFMNGLPRNSLGSEFNFILWLFSLFSPYTAYVINLAVIRIVAFSGMYLLLNSHFLPQNDKKIIIYGAALSFAILPFHPFGGLSVAGQPIVLYAFLNIRKRFFSIWNWVILSAIPFYSSFLLSFSFFLMLMILLFIYDFVRDAKINWVFALSILFMFFLYVIVEYRLFYSIIIDTAYVSHRVEFGSTTGGVLLFHSFVNSIVMLLLGQYHAASVHGFVILPTLAIVIWLSYAKGMKCGPILLFTAIIITTSFFYGIWEWRGLDAAKSSIGVFSSFQFTRLHFLNPMLWYLLFALTLSFLHEHMQKSGHRIVCCLVLLQMIILFYQHDAIQQRGNPTYKEFFAEDLFAAIESHIGRDKADYRVMSLGLHPSISQYNGFYSLDAYVANYPLDYKHQFRKIIAAELEKDEKLREYFDDWGSRCYAFSAEIGRDFLNNNHSTVRNLDFDFEQIRKMGGEYIISSTKIDTEYNPQLLHRGTFTSDSAYWTLYLYEINTILQSSFGS